MATDAEVRIALENIEQGLERFRDPNPTDGAWELFGVIVDNEPALRETPETLALEPILRALSADCESYRAAATAARDQPSEAPQWRLVSKYAASIAERLNVLYPMIGMTRHGYH